MQRTALITGAAGQDGHYLAEVLLERGYRVFGLIRRSSQGKSVPPGIDVVEGDVTDAGGIMRLFRQARPDEVYHLAAQSHVGLSFDLPRPTFEVNTLGCINVLEAARLYGARMFQASTSEMYGNSGGPLTERSPFRPVSPYGISKLAAHQLCWQFRRGYGQFVSCGIMFNHESPRRGVDFVTQKIATGVARIQAGYEEQIVLGNIEVARDWSHARDCMRAAWLMLQQDQPDDFVIASGTPHTIGDFLAAAWGPDWQRIVATDEALYRPIDVRTLCGDSSRAQAVLGWQPEISFEALVHEMVAAAAERIRRQENRPDGDG